MSLALKQCLCDPVYLIPLRTPLFKVPSDTKPYSKLEPTTLNGEEGGYAFY